MGIDEVPRRAAPGRGWYGVIAALMLATVCLTATMAYGRATDLMTTVDGFDGIHGSDSSTVSVTEAGEYGVYQETPDGPVDDEYLITVNGPDGAAVPVVPSEARYGWGARRGRAVVTFEATEPGPYTIAASGAPGPLAFGPRIPGAPLYGFGGVLLGAGSVLVACVAGLVVVARQRRSPTAAPVDVSDDGRRRMYRPDGDDRRPTHLTGDDDRSGQVSDDHDRRRTYVIAAVALLAAGAAGGVGVVLAADDGDGGGTAMATAQDGSAQQPSSTIECVSDADYETGRCGLTPEELRETNLGYADRLAFAGDLAAASEVADRARTALSPLADVQPAPSAEQVATALEPVSPSVVVATDAVRTAGTAFAIAVEGGCVFGAVHGGAVEVEIGGYVNDGGCLASYGH